MCPLFPLSGEEGAHEPWGLEPRGLRELVLYQMPDLIASRTDPLHREVSCPAVHKFPALAIGQQPGTRQPSLKSGWENGGPGTWGENKRNPEWAPPRKPTLGLPNKVVNSFSSRNKGLCCRYHCRCLDALEPVKTVVPFSRWASASWLPAGSSGSQGGFLPGSPGGGAVDSVSPSSFLVALGPWNLPLKQPVVEPGL